MDIPAWPQDGLSPCLQDSEPSSAPLTMPTSRSESPSRLLLPKAKKRVNWNVPEEDPAEKPSFRMKHDLATHEEGTMGREEQIEELRRQLTRDLPDNRPSNTSNTLSRPKPVLRRGDQTPPSGFVTPLDEPYEFISDRDNKTRSAEDAQERALVVQRSVTDKPHTSISGKKDRRGRSSARLSSFVKDLYYYPESLKSGQTTPLESDPLGFDEDSVSRPEKYRISGLSAQSLLQRLRSLASRAETDSDTLSRSTSASPHPSRNPSLISLVEVSSNLGSWAAHGATEKAFTRPSAECSTSKRPSIGRRRSTVESILESMGNFSRKRLRGEEVQTNFERQKNETEDCQRYLLKLCRAFLIFGVPTYRVENLLDNAAKALKIDAQFFYLPGCIFVSFGDEPSRTSQVKLVKAVPGLDLGKMGKTYVIYKDIFHGDQTPPEAADGLDDLIKEKKKHSTWLLVSMYGLASLSVGPFAFQAQWLDLPIAFILGCILGCLKVIWSLRSTSYANVFEVISVIITTFLARWMGSIRHHSLFCFSNLAQSSIALILPGFTVLVGVLELQSRSLIAGGARVMYATVYSLTLGFSMTAGISLYGVINHNASSEPVCAKPIASYYFPIFVPLFTLAVMVINQATWRQMPVMMVISCIGYAVSFGINQGLILNGTMSAAAASLVIGLLANSYARTGHQVDNLQRKGGNWLREKLGRHIRSPIAEKGPSLYSSGGSAPSSDGEDLKKGKAKRYHSSILQRAREYIEKSTREKRDRHSEDLEAGLSDDDGKPRNKHLAHTLAACTMLPALLVQVPSGISATGSLVSGIQAANELFGNRTTEEPSANEIVQGITYSNVSFTVGYSLIQVAIGMTAGLFLASIIVYPRGKDADRGGSSKRRFRGALFSF